MSYVGIVISLVFINNIALNLLLGVCVSLDATRRLASALTLGVAVAVVSSLAALLTWAIQHLILAPLGIVFLQTVVFVLLAGALALLLEGMATRFPLGRGASLDLPVALVAANSAVFGITLIAVRADYDPLGSLLAGLGAGGGFLLVLLLLSLIREKLEAEWIPRPLRGLPITFITLGLMALAFAAFDKGLLANLMGR